MNKFRYKVRTGPEEETIDGQKKYLTEEVPTDAYGMIDFVQNSRTTTAEVTTSFDATTLRKRFQSYRFFPL